MRRLLFFLVTVLLFAANVSAEQRFPKPEFENGYTQPATQVFAPRSAIMEYVDLAVLIASLSVVTWLVLKKRSRRGVWLMSIFSLLYFGFYREGCVCSVGSIQNVTAGLFNPEFTVPLTVIAFFVIPLVFTLFFGRTFCAGVCPLGAIQDIIAFKPMPLKSWVQTLLGLLPYIYFGLAVLYAATATDFIICRYDPFVGFFRFNATFMMFAIGGALLLVGVFIARPYCRFLCPYGVLLNLVSRFSNKHLSIAPTKCIECRLCENSCPFGAINKPTPSKNPENTNTAVKRLILFCVITPLLMALCGWTGARLHQKMAMVNPKVRIANELLQTKDGERQSFALSTFKSSGKPIDKLYAEAAVILRKFYIGGWILGGFIGLVLGVSLASLTLFKHRTDYTTNKGTCFSCARCVDYCPVKNEE
jgi:NosR/NirI family transcriptional regulator, nitrous oxide reductase regulator